MIKFKFHLGCDYSPWLSFLENLVFPLCYFVLGGRRFKKNWQYKICTSLGSKFVPVGCVNIDDYILFIVGFISLEVI